MDIELIREQIPALRDKTYLDTGWSGPSPTRVVNALTERLRFESLSGPTATEVIDSGKAITKQTRNAVADLLNTSSDEILLTQNTTDGLNTVMNGLPWQPGDEVITCDLERKAITVRLQYIRCTPTKMARRRRGRRELVWTIRLQ